MCSPHKTVQELFNDLCRHLSASGAVISTSEQFASLSSNVERVRFVNDLFEKFKLWPQVSAGCAKNCELSGQYRQEGNTLFKLKRDGEALKMYTKSIAFAAEKSETLGLAFANRSAVLFERKLYRECLEDIQNAIDNNYPSHLFEKIEKRRSNAESLLNKQNQLQYYTEIPKLSSSPNPLIQCASDAVEIKETEDMGRHVIASSDISPGDVIALEKPFAKMLLKESALDHCHNCLKLSYNLLPCPQCTEALFCSKFCLKEATDLYHKYECPVLAFLYNFKFSKLELIAVRVTLLAKNQYFGSCYKKSEIYKSERYQEIHELVTNTEKRSVADLFKKAAVAAMLCHIFEKYSAFPFDDYREIFTDLVLHHLQTGPSNFHEISECVGSMTDCYATEDIGCGTFSFLSLFNHACSPNVVRHCHGCTVVLRALRPIKKGEQIFDNYGYHHALMSKKERREHLKAQYLFECSCKACEEDWPLYHDLKSLDYNLNLEPEDLKALKGGCLQTARVIVSDLIKKLEQLDESIPSRNLADAQEIVKQCFAIFGNKRSVF